jgi:hypothetical protein
MLESTCEVAVSVFNRDHMIFALNLSAYLVDERSDLASAMRSVTIDENKVVRIKFIPVLTKSDIDYVRSKFAFVRGIENMHGFTLQII